MSERSSQDATERRLPAIPPFLWVLVVVALLLATVACGLWAAYALRLRQPLAGPSPTPIIWTATPRPTAVTLPTPTETAAPTPAPSPDIAVGQTVQVSGTGGAGVSMREEPDVNSPRLDVAREGVVFLVVDGPRQIGGYVWWRIRDLEDEARQGWVVGNYVRPVEQP